MRSDRRVGIEAVFYLTIGGINIALGASGLILMIATACIVFGALNALLFGAYKGWWL